MLRDGRKARREITLLPKRPDDASCLEASGAIKLAIHDFLPELQGNMVLPPGLDLEYGVTGHEVWPVSIDDIEMEEEDEVAELNDQNLDFMQTRGATPVRSGITVVVSNQAIDSAGFDLLAYLRKKFGLAERRYLASHLYSTARWDGNNGPFSGAHASQWSIPQGSLYDSIMAQMTLLEMEGYDTRDAVIIMDHPMEVRLKTTPIRPEEGRMVIQDGLCCGYPYIANKYYNTELNDEGRLVRKATDAVSIGIFKWFKIAQHGEARLTIDGKSEAMAKRNCTSVCLSTDWSFTNLSEKVNGGTGVQAFRTLMMRKGYLRDVNEMVFRTSDGMLLRVGLNDLHMVLVDRDGNILQSSDAKAFQVNLNPNATVNP